MLDIIFKLDPDGTFDYFMSLGIQIMFFNSKVWQEKLWVKQSGKSSSAFSDFHYDWIFKK